MSRRKPASEAAEINVWPSSLPEDVGSIVPPSGELSVDSDELGRRYLTDAVEQDIAPAPRPFGDEYDDLELDARTLDGVLRSFGLDPRHARRRSGVRVVPPQVRRPTARSPVSLPDEVHAHDSLVDELDLTEEAIHDASLLDREGEEVGEVRSPWLRTEDTRTHGKPRGGHARVSVRSVMLKR